MNLHTLLRAREKTGHPIHVGLIGAGKFCSMFLAQVRHTPGIHIMGIADLAPDRAHAALLNTGWPEEQSAAPSFEAARRSGATRITDSAVDLIAADGMEVVIDATGHPTAGIDHVLACCMYRRHIIMVNVEADALAGPLLARKAREAGIVYSMAYGDQPALICEMVDWARTCGLTVIAAGKGTRYLPTFHASTPDTVWNHYGISAKRAAVAGMNRRMFNSFLDGTKSGIEMTAVANATGLTPAPGGLTFPPCPAPQLARILIPAEAGGLLHHKGQVEVIAAESRDGTELDNNLRWGVFVTFEAPSDYTALCFEEYGLITDDSGRYSALWRPYHLIGLELGVSVAYAALLEQPTGSPDAFRADVVATAKRDLKVGEVLDGEGGYTVWGKLMSATESLSIGALPIGLACNVTLTSDISAGCPVRWANVRIDDTSTAVRFRREMETLFNPSGELGARAST
ncbi:MAG: NAD(P)H-dependent oxidoreductase [Rhodospirillales bacterium]